MSEPEVGQLPTEGVGDRGGWARSSLLAAALMTSTADYHDREIRLCRCACALRFARRFRREHFTLVGHARRIADGDVPPRPRESGEADLLTGLVSDLTHELGDGGDYFFRLLALAGDRREDRAAEVAAQEVIVRDVFGDPRRAHAIDGRWLTADVVGLARYAYGSGDFFALPILADALQDAGCEDAAVLDHCRAGGPHVMGCWVVDELLQFRSDEFRLRAWGRTDPLTDPLTGLGSRLAFEAVLGREFGRAAAATAPLSALTFDLDDFRRVNTTFGILTGDRVLVGVARLLRDTLGGSGFLARTGGDRFGVVLPATDLRGALEVGERLRRAVEDWRWAADEGGEPDQVLTITVGAGTLRPGETNYSRFVGDADYAYHEARRAGPNRVGS